MKIQALISLLHQWAPAAYQESYDNSTLICGNTQNDIQKVLVCLDVTEDVLDEAIQLGANLIIAHHPIIFKGLKKLTGSNYVERTLIKAIKNDISIFALHTNLDNVLTGVNREIANRMGIENPKILLPKSDILYKLIVFVPLSHAESLAQALFNVGVGKIGNYDMASFRSKGTGTFRPLEHANPHTGTVLNFEEVEEIKLEFIVEKHLLQTSIQTMLEVHPYEAVAYDCIELQNIHNEIGSGMIGNLDNNISMADFLKMIKEKFGLHAIKYTGNLQKNVQRIAWCGGSGIFLLSEAKKQKADVFLTADVKYHEFFDAENQISIVDIGHYESEQFTIDLIIRKIQAQFDGISVSATSINTNPVQIYL